MTTLNNYTVYIHENKINHKIYVGITSEEKLYMRWKNGYGYKNNEHFFNAIKKYGWENFEHHIIATKINKESACMIEKELIQTYQSYNYNHGYNQDLGGTHNNHSDETKSKIGNANRGRPSWIKGKKLTDKQKENVVEAANNRTREHLDKIAAAKWKRIKCIELDLIFESRKAAMEFVGKGTWISEVIDNPNRTFGGYHWISIGD